MAKCEECGIETKQLFENVYKNEIKLVCKDCRSTRYVRYDYETENTKKVSKL